MARADLPGPVPFRLNAVTIFAHRRRPQGTNSCWGQGNRISVVWHLVKMFLIPAGPFAFGSDADAGGFLICVVDESM